MKRELTFLIAGFLPGLAAAQISAEPLIAIGLLAGKRQCVAQFSSMRPSLDSAFQAFVQKNNRFFDTAAWQVFDAAQFPFSREMTEEECMAYAQELSSLDADKLIERVRSEVACKEQVSNFGERRPRIGIDLGEGARATTTVQKVEPASPAHIGGLRPGDVVLEVGSTPVQTPCDLMLAVGSLAPGKAVKILVVRGDSQLLLSVIPVMSGKQ